MRFVLFLMVMVVLGCCTVPVTAQVQSAMMGNALMASSNVQNGCTPLQIIGSIFGADILNKFLNPRVDRVHNTEFTSIEFVTRSGKPCNVQFSIEQGWFYVPTGAICLVKFSSGSGAPVGKWRFWFDNSEILDVANCGKEIETRREFADDHFVAVAYDIDANLCWYVPRNASCWWDFAKCKAAWPSGATCRQYKASCVGRLATLKFETETKVGATRGYPFLTFVKTDGNEILNSLIDPEVRRINALTGNTGTNEMAYRPIVDRDTGRTYYVEGDEATWEDQMAEQDQQLYGGPAVVTGQNNVPVNQGQNVDPPKVVQPNPPVANPPVKPQVVNPQIVRGNFQIHGKSFTIKPFAPNGGAFVGESVIRITVGTKTVTMQLSGGQVFMSGRWLPFDGRFDIPAPAKTVFSVEASGFTNADRSGDTLILR